MVDCRGGWGMESGGFEFSVYLGVNKIYWVRKRFY